MEKVQINSETGFLNGTLIYPEKIKLPGQNVLFIHGWKGNEDGYILRAKYLADIGYTCLTFNLPGHGTSNGDIRELTRADYLRAVVSAYDFLEKIDNVSGHAVGVVGASFGAYLGILLTSKRLVKCLALRAPANYRDDGFSDVPQEKYNSDNPDKLEWRHRQLNKDQTLSLRALHDYPREVLIIESEYDELFPHRSTQNYIDAVSDPSKLTYKIINGADHHLSTNSYQREFVELLANWFPNKLAT